MMAKLGVAQATLWPAPCLDHTISVLLPPKTRQGTWKNSIATDRLQMIHKTGTDHCDKPFAKDKQKAVFLESISISFTS